MSIIPLSPIDHIFTGAGSYPIEFVFGYRDTLDAERLLASLEETLESFPPLRSQLTRIADHSLGLKPVEDGLRFEIIKSSELFGEASDPTVFLDTVDSVEGEPLTKIRLTHTPEGSVLGISISHAVADGFSYFTFLSCWARSFQGKAIPPPSHQRELLLPAKPMQWDAITPADILELSGLFWCGRRADISREQNAWERLQFSNEVVNDLLNEAQQESDLRLTHNDVVTAFLWKKFVPMWNGGGGSNPATYISVPFDFRRVLEWLPQAYFGVAVTLVTASLDLESLEKATLGELAGLIRTTVNRVDPQRVAASLEILEGIRRQKGLGVLEEIHVMHPDDGLLVTNLSRLPVQALDFGAGQPTGFQIFTPAQRGAVILPAEDGMDIRVYHPTKAGQKGT